MKCYFIFLVLYLGSIFNCTNCRPDTCDCCDEKFTAQCTTDDNTVIVTRDQTTLITPPALPRTCTFSFPRQPGVCQIRLDFPQFSLNGPNTAGECLTDSMTVSNTVTVESLQICGNGASAARHMYLDYGASNGPIRVSLRTDGPLMDMPNNMYGYQILATQILCDSSRRVPQDCLQYYTDVSGVVSSFNYAASMGQQLNNEDYKVCVEKHNPGDRIQWTTCNGTNPMPVAGNGPVNEPSNMCLIGDTSAGCFPLPLPPDAPCNTDYVEIPGSTKGRYCNAMPPVGFPKSITTTNFWIRVKLDQSEPAIGAMPIILGPAPCNAASYPISLPGYNLVDVQGNCVLQPNSMMADIQNAGFCLAYAIVPSSTPLGDVL